MEINAISCREQTQLVSVFPGSGLNSYNLVYSSCRIVSIKHDVFKEVCAFKMGFSLWKKNVTPSSRKNSHLTDNTRYFREVFHESSYV